jgi:quinol monooxygenase YgiN
MAFHHVVLFRWQPGVTAEQLEEITAALQALSATLEGCESYSCGPGLGLSETSFDYGVVARFRDRAAWDAYMADAEHDRIRAELILPIVTERAGIQLEA